MNIVFITSDQQRGDCYGFEGRKVKTPHLDAMARAGTRFSACITPNLVCQPSRASILTGLLPYTHGVSDNGIDLDPKVGAAGFAGAFTKALKNPVVIERLAGAGLEVAPSASPEAYGQFIRAEYARWPAIVKAAGDGAKIQ